MRFSLPAGVTTDELPAEVKAATVTATDGSLEAHAHDPLPLLGVLAAWATARDLQLPDLAVSRPTLEDVYLRPHQGEVMSVLAPTIERPASRRGKRRNLVVHQFRYELRSFLRNRQGVFFTIALPVMFLVIFASVFGHGTVRVPGGTLHVAIYYVPGIIAMGIISASFGNLAASVVGTREAGIYKRRRATPVSAVVLIAARALAAVTVAVAITAVLLAIGHFYGASVPTRALPALALDVSSAASPSAVWATPWPASWQAATPCSPPSCSSPCRCTSSPASSCASSVLPHWLQHVANVFPVRHLASALLAVYNPHAAATGIRWGDLAILATWGVAGLLVAVRRFSWLPRGG